MTHRISPATVIASVALFFSLGGVGMAATGYRITSIWQIAPKVRHALRGERGPRGLPGPAGQPGAQGSPGSQGPAAPQATSSFFYSVYASAWLRSAQTVHVTARCNERGKLIAGGVIGSGDVVSSSVPFGLDGWFAAGHLDPQSPVPGHGQIVAWAFCAN